MIGSISEISEISFPHFAARSRFTHLSLSPPMIRLTLGAIPGFPYQHGAAYMFDIGVLVLR